MDVVYSCFYDVINLSKGDEFYFFMFEIGIKVVYIVVDIVICL